MKKLRPLVAATSLFAAVVGLVQIAMPTPAAAAAPTAPNFRSFAWSPRDGFVTLFFEDQSSNEQGFRIQHRTSSAGSWQLVEELPSTGAAKGCLVNG